MLKKNTIFKQTIHHLNNSPYHHSRTAYHMQNPDIFICLFYSACKEKHFYSARKIRIQRIRANRQKYTNARIIH